MPRNGGAVVESFDATALEQLSPPLRSAAVDGIARDISDAVKEIRGNKQGGVRPGCSPTGCPR